MAVWLLLEKRIKCFQTSYTVYRKDTDHEGDTCYNPDTTTLCGEGDCNHIECAVYAAKAHRSEKSPGISYFLIMLLGGIACAGIVADRFDFLPAIYIIPAAAFIFGLKVKSEANKYLGRKLDEIREFSEKGTVSEIPARQIYCVKAPKYKRIMTAAIFFGPICLAWIFPGYEIVSILLFLAAITTINALCDGYYLENGAYRADLVKYSLDPKCLKVRKRN